MLSQIFIDGIISLPNVTSYDEINFNLCLSRIKRLSYLLRLDSAGPLWSLQVDDAGDGGGGMSGLESAEESLSGFTSGL